jgi:hypothetical protein
MESSKLLFRMPGQKTWAGLETLDSNHMRPDTIIEIKDTSCGNNYKSWEKSQRLGKIPYELAKIKYSIS